jgi:hypothetical protein
MIKFLNVFRWIALAAVCLSFLAFGAFGLVPVLFCDSGPASACFAATATIWSVPFVQAVLFTISWVLLKRSRYVFISAGFMILSVLPLVLFKLMFS